MNFVKSLKAESAMASQPGTNTGNPYVYSAIGGKNPTGKPKPGAVNLNVMGQAPGQTFPTVRGIGDTNASPPVYTAPGDPVTVAAKEDDLVQKANPHRHDSSGQFITTPVSGSPSHDQRTRKMFSTLSTRQSLRTTQETLAPVHKAEVLAVVQVPTQSRLDNAAVYKVAVKEEDLVTARDTARSDPDKDGDTDLPGGKDTDEDEDKDIPSKAAAIAAKAVCAPAKKSDPVADALQAIANMKV